MWDYRCALLLLRSHYLRKATVLRKALRDPELVLLL